VLLAADQNGGDVIGGGVERFGRKDKRSGILYDFEENLRECQGKNGGFGDQKVLSEGGCGKWRYKDEWARST